MKKLHLLIGLPIVAALVMVPNAQGFLPLQNGGTIIISDILAGFCNIAAQGQLVFNCNGPNATLYLTHGNGITIHAFQNNQTLWFNGTGSQGAQGPTGAQGPPGPNTLDTIQNTGGGQASVYKGNTTNFNFQFKTISVSGGGLGITNASSLLTITSTALTNAVLTLNGNSGNSQTVQGTFGQVNVTNAGNIHTISLPFKINNGTCGSGRFSSFDNKTGNFVCTGGTGGVTSLNGFQGILKIVPQVANTTILNNTGVITVGLGANPVITNGATQTVTKQLVLQQLKLSGNENANSMKIINLNNATLPNDAVNARRLGLLGNMTYGNKCSDTQILSYQASNQTWICANKPNAGTTTNVTYPIGLIIYPNATDGQYYLKNIQNTVVTHTTCPENVMQYAANSTKKMGAAITNGTYTFCPNFNGIILQNNNYFKIDPNAILVVPSGFTKAMYNVAQPTATTFDTEFINVDGGTVQENSPKLHLWTGIEFNMTCSSCPTNGGMEVNTFQNMWINGAKRMIGFDADSSVKKANINGNFFYNVNTIQYRIGIDEEFIDTGHLAVAGNDGFNGNIFNNIFLEAGQGTNNIATNATKNLSGQWNQYNNIQMWDLNTTAGGQPNTASDGNFVKGSKFNIISYFDTDSAKAFVDNGTDNQITRAGAVYVPRLGLGGCFATGSNNLIRGCGNQTSPIVDLESYGGTTTFLGQAAGGTQNNPTATSSSTTLAQLVGKGYTGTQFSAQNIAAVRLLAFDNPFNGGSQGTYIDFRTTPSGQQIPQTVFQINNNGSLGMKWGETLCFDSISCLGGTKIFAKNQTNQIIIQVGGRQALNITKSTTIFPGNEDFGSGTDIFGSGAIIIRNPQGTFADSIKGAAVTSNQTLLMPTGTATLLSNSSKIMDLADVGGQPCTDGWILTWQTSNSTWICKLNSGGGVTSLNGLTGAIKLLRGMPNMTNSFTNSSNNITWNPKPNIVLTNGSLQIITKNIDHTGNIGFGRTGTPAFPIDINETSAGSNTIITAWNSFSPNLIFRESGGTPGTQTASASGDNLALVSGRGSTGAGTFSGDAVRMMFKADQAFTTVNTGTKIVFSTTVDTIGARHDNFQIGNLGDIGARWGTKYCFDAIDCTGGDYIISNNQTKQMNIYVNNVQQLNLTTSSFNILNNADLKQNLLNIGSSKLIIRNPASTFATTITNAAITANRTLNLPLLNGTETVGIVHQSNFTAPGNKTATSSLAGVMLGGQIQLTPHSTKVKLQGQVIASDGTLGDGCRIEIRQSTSYLGSNGVAAAGSVVGTNIKAGSTGTPASELIPTPIYGIAQNLTPGTKYFFDLDFAAIGGGTCTLTNFNWDASDYP